MAVRRTKGTTKLKRLLARCHALGRATRSHQHDYRFDWAPPSISDDHVSLIERHYQVTLPADYRGFLIEVANGGAGPTYYPMHDLQSAFRRSGRVAQPFPLTGTWLRHEPGEIPPEHDWRRRDLEHGGLVESWLAPSLLRDLPNGSRETDGTLLIAESGCGLDYELVLVGPHRGEIWHSREGGIGPVYASFTSFMMDWLENELAGNMPVRRPATQMETGDRTFRSRRVHALLSEIEDDYVWAIESPMTGYTWDEYQTSRMATEESGVFEWSFAYALSETDRARSLGANETVVTLALARLYVQRERADVALCILERHDASCGSADAAETRVYRGMLLAQMGRKDEARVCFETGLANDLPMHRRVTALRYLGRTHEVQRLCDAQNRDAPEEWAVFEKATDLLQNGRKADAFAALRLADPTYLDPFLLARAPEWRPVQNDPRYAAMVKAWLDDD